MKNKINSAKQNKIIKAGFTLVELLIVITLIGMLTIISIASFSNVNRKARDSQRKSDLENLSKALMMYYNDNGNFPDENLVVFGYGANNMEAGFTGPNGVVYIRKIPIDPINSSNYMYKYKVDPVGKSFFNLFTNLENKNDLQCKTSLYGVINVGTSFCYGVSSPNNSLINWL